MRPSRFSLVLCPVIALALVTASPGKERTEVTVAYVLAPPRPLPEGLKAVAVIDSGVQTQGNKEDQRERKWSNMAADMIESMLGNSAARFGSGLLVAQRRLTKQILEEKDLKLAGLVDAPSAERAGKLLDVQGLITSRITINLDIQKTRKSTVDWGQMLGVVAQGMSRGGPGGPPPRAVVAQPYPGGPPPAPVAGRPQYTRQNRTVIDPRTGRPVAPAAVYADPRSRDPRLLRYRRYSYDPRYRSQPAVILPPGTVVARPVAPVAPAPAPMPVMPAGGPPGVGLKEVEEVSRHLTVQCSFTLVDAVTGQTLLQYSPPAYQKEDKASPDFLFGSVKEVQLDPVDHFIGELIERATQEFVSLLVPVEVEYRFELMGKHSRAEAGIRALRADDFETAFAQFEAEARKEPKEHEAFFALGVISELMGIPAHALGYYRKAASMDDVDSEELHVYVSSKKRLTEQLPRIMKAPPPGSVTWPEGASPGSSAPPASPPPAPDNRQ